MEVRNKLKNMSNKAKGAVIGGVTAVGTALGSAVTALAADGTVDDGVNAAKTLLTEAQKHSILLMLFLSLVLVLVPFSVCSLRGGALASSLVCSRVRLQKARQTFNNLLFHFLKGWGKPHSVFYFGGNYMFVFIFFIILFLFVDFMLYKKLVNHYNEQIEELCSLYNELKNTCQEYEFRITMLEGNSDV